MPTLSEKELRTWTLKQFAPLDDLVIRNTVDLSDRQMVEVFVERIEINPETKTAVIYLLTDLEEALRRSSTRGPEGCKRQLNTGMKKSRHVGVEIAPTSICR